MCVNNLPLDVEYSKTEATTDIKCFARFRKEFCVYIKAYSCNCALKFSNDEGNKIKHRPCTEKHFFPLLSKNYSANCIWKTNLHFAVPFEELGEKHCFFGFFYCLHPLWTIRSLYFLETVQTEKGMWWHLLDIGLFVFHLFLQSVSAFMSSLRQNIKEAHSLLILTMTIQSFQRTDFTVCACTFHTEKSGCCHYFLNIPW